MNTVYRDLNIFSKYGPDWAEQVERVCEEVEWYTCEMLRNSVGKGYAEMSLQQLDHMWQISFSGEFDKYNPDFCENNGWGTDMPEFPVEDISGVVLTNIYVDNDPYCNPETQQALLDPLSVLKVTMMDEAITHTTIAAANDQTYFVNLLKYALSQGSNFEVEGECNELNMWM